MSPTRLPTGAPLVLPAAVAWGVLSALVVTGKSTRDALFCAYYPATELPQTMMAGAALAALVALASARLAGRAGPARVLSSLLALSALGFVGEHALMERAPRPGALIVYLHVSAVTGVLMSSFWSVVNERLDPHALRRSVARIGLGGTLGGFLGGLSAERIAAWAGARHALLELAITSGLCSFGVWRLGAVEAPAAEQAPPQPARALGSSYLRQIALFVGLTTLSSSLVDFAFKARAMERFASPEALMQFFAIFYTSVSLASFLVQATVTPRVLERAGLGAGLASHPALLATSAAAALAVPGFGAQALLRGTDGALVASLLRSAYEPLYTPLAAGTKRTIKGVIDVLVNRFGDGVGSLLAWLLVLLWPGQASLLANVLVMAAALAALGVVAALRQGYIAELAESLRSGVVVLDELGVQDQTTRLTLSRTMSDLNRERLLAEIERQRGLATPEGAAPSSERGPRQARLVADLLSRDPARLQAALEAAEPALTAFIIPLVERSDVGAQAMKVLGGFGERIVGQLSDALHDAERVSPTVRRRLVRVITSSHCAWAAAALAAALEDPDFDVRRQIVRGLEDMSEGGVAPPLERGPALAAAARELENAWGPPERERLDHVLRLLGLVFDREAFRLARSAIGHGDDKLHGTALEYLDNVLPAAIKGSLFARLPPAATLPPPRSRRVEQELLDELRRTFG